jgi:uroporphyrinogen-III synthase
LTPMHAPRCDAVALVTRPGEAGQRLSAALRDRGLAALWWPAFDLLAPLDLQPLRALSQRLAEFDLVVFVSAAAVRGFAQLDLGSEWPAATAIAAVGPSTLQLALGVLPGARGARTVGLLAGKLQAGSEALWQALRQAPIPRQVLIVRADSGRDWLAERLREAGSAVEHACVYRREIHAPSDEQRAGLAALIGAYAHAVTLVTSSEAVAALDRQLETAPQARTWLRQGLALGSHPRIVQALQAAGYARVSECELSPASVLLAIQGARPGDQDSMLAEVRTR